MPDPLDEDPTQDYGPFMGFLNWLGRPGHAVRDLLTGNVGGAGRQFVDFLSDIPGAVTPGHLIPNLTDRHDYVEPHQLVGMDEETPWYYRVPTDIGLGIVTDPLSLIGVGEIGAGVRGAATVAKEVGKDAALQAGRSGLRVGVPFTKLGKTFDLGFEVDPIANAGRLYSELTPQPIQDAISPAARAIKSAFGAEDVSPEVRELIGRARATGANIGKAQEQAIRDAFEGATPEERALMFNVIRNVREGKAGWEELLPNSNPRNPIYDLAKQTDELVPASVSSEATALPASESMYKRIVPVPTNPETGELETAGLDYLQKAIPEFSEPEVPSLARMLGATPGTLPEAFPMVKNEPRFASGSDLTNDVLGAGPERIALRRGDDTLAPSLDDPQMGVDLARGFVERGVTSGHWTVDPLTGGKTWVERPAQIELPTSAGAAALERMGGPKAEMVRMSAGQAPELTSKFDTIENQLKRWDSRVDALELDAAKADRLKELLRKYLDVSHGQLKEATQDFPAFFKPEGIDLERETRADYLMGKYEGPIDNELSRDALTAGKPSTIRERSLGEGSDLAAWLNEKGMKPETDALKLAAGRASQQARLGAKTTVGKELIDKHAEAAFGKKFRGEELTDAEQKALDARYDTLAGEGSQFDPAVKAIIKEMHDAGHVEDATALKNIYEGLPARSAPMQLLAKAMQPWKAAVVYGLAVPRVGALFRNRLSGAPMTASTPGAEAAVGHMSNPIQIISDVWSAVAHGLGLDALTTSKAMKDSLQIDAAFRSAAGRASEVPHILRAQGRDDLALAVENGVTDGFVSSEKLVGDINARGWKKWMRSILESPARMFQATESQMRLATFQKILEGGRAPAEAAGITRSALYDYGTNSVANRTARTWLPFFQFSAKAIPQQAKWIARQPAAGVAMSQIYGQHTDEPIYPYLSEKSGFSLGRNEDGTLGYAGGFGLPSDALSMIPGFSGGVRGLGRDLERNWVASTAPPVKAAYSALSGRDPYFGTDSFSFDKIPLLGHAGAAGRAYNAAVNSGIAPLAGIHGALQQAQSLGDDLANGGAGTAALDFLTGTNVVNVDQNRAMQQILQDRLSLDPDVHKYESLYTNSSDPETRKLLEEYNAMRAKVKAEKAKAKSTSIL